MAEGGSKLSEEQIYECLKSLNVPVRMNDLKVPSREFIVRVFECFLKDLQLDIGSFELRTWEATNHIEDGDIYEDAELLTLLAMSVNHITNPWGLNITIKDVVEPKPKRTKKILNYLLVFWNYYLQKYARFHAIEETFEGERKKVEDVMAENESLDEKYNDMLKSLNSMQPSKEELSSTVKVKEEKAEKLKTESELIGSDYQTLKSDELRIKNEMGAIDVRIITTKERLEELSQLILSSPERINTEIQRLEDRIRTEDVKIKELENRLKDAVKKLELQEEAEKEEEKVLSTLNETNEIDKHLRNTVKSIVDVHQKINEEDDRVKRLQMDLERKEEWKLQQEQKSAKVVLNTKKQVETLKEVLKMNQKEEIEVKEAIQFVKAVVADMQEIIDSETNNILDIIKKCKDADSRSKERKFQFISKMNEISHKFKSDCEEVVDIIQMTLPNAPEPASSFALE